MAKLGFAILFLVNVSSRVINLAEFISVSGKITWKMRKFAITEPKGETSRFFLKLKKNKALALSFYLSNYLKSFCNHNKKGRPEYLILLLISFGSGEC